MARKLRFEYPGAVYHVLNRGNFRRDLFQGAGEAQVFQTTLAEATARYGWRLHAYAIMRNHYHLAVETPEPNLSAGMHWLQSAFGTRFNRFRVERGHLFEGRFHALIVEDVMHLARLVDYLHLNPLRAGIVTPDQLAAFRWGSLSLWLKGKPFKGMDAETWLAHHGLEPTTEGWRDYLDHLWELAEDAKRQIDSGFESMSRGWAIGTEAWRKALAKEHAQMALNPGLPAAEARALREAGWQKSLRGALKAEGKRLEEVVAATKSAAWKVEIARQVREDSGAAVSWLCDQLKLGSPDSARVYLSQAMRKQREN